MRFFLARDNSSHWYFWNDWMDLSEDDPAAWSSPAACRRVDGPSHVTFTDPRES